MANHHAKSINFKYEVYFLFNASLFFKPYCLPE